jgi:prepilin-type N-terminal cleavage/methylation domain-containing protein
VKDRSRDDGFSLVELLVVMVILGVLAAIAIPAFLNQRRSGYDTSAKSDLRNFATLEEEHLQERDFYGSIAQLQANGEAINLTKHVTVTVVHYDVGTGYCLSAKHASSDTTWYFDSLARGVQDPGATGCPVTTSGAAGGSLTG